MDFGVCYEMLQKAPSARSLGVLDCLKYWLKVSKQGQVWWLEPAAPALRRLSQDDSCEFEASLGYKVSDNLS